MQLNDSDVAIIQSYVNETHNTSNAELAVLYSVAFSKLGVEMGTILGPESLIALLKGLFRAGRS